MVCPEMADYSRSGEQRRVRLPSRFSPAFPFDQIIPSVAFIPSSDAIVQDGLNLRFLLVNGIIVRGPGSQFLLPVNT
jgi:hypothetical protein